MKPGFRSRAAQMLRRWLSVQPMRERHPACRIGAGAVVGARAVVSKDVPAYAAIAGKPSRIVNYRFEPATIERLLRIKGWKWDTARIERAPPALLSSDIEAFMQAAESGKM
jgi:hypothetical protein